MYFDLGSDWNLIEDKYNLDNKDMFNMFNKIALDYAEKKGTTFRFTHDPRNEQGNTALADEWKYLQDKYGYTELDERDGYWYATK